MKKLLAVLFAAAVMAAGVFAQENSQSIEGTWTDSAWNAEWIFNLSVANGGSIELKDASNGQTVYTFTKSSAENWEVKAGTDGLQVTFDCKATERSYKFVKPIALSTDIKMEIQPDWTSDLYKVDLKKK